MKIAEISKKTWLAAGLFAAAVAAIAYAAIGGASSQGDEAWMREARPIPSIDSVWMEELTWMEVRDLIASGTTTVIVPTGGVEQNGPYLATGKHNFVLREVCEAVARELQDALCAPVVRYVPQGDPGRIRHPDTLSLTEATFEAVLTDVGASLASQGFRDILFIGDSGGNQAGMAKVASALNQQWQGTPRAHYIEEYYYQDIWSCTFLKETLGIVQRPDRCVAVRGRHHHDVHYTAIVAVNNPRHIRAHERLEAGLFVVNGVNLGSIDKTVQLGRTLIDYRTGIAVAAIRKRLAGVEAAD